MSLRPPPGVVEKFDYKWRNWLSELFRVIVRGDNVWESLSLLNSWVNFGSGFSTAQFIKHPGGLVEVKGFIKDGTATTGTVLATLPVGFRPAEGRVFGTISNNLIGRVDVQADGDITIEVGTNTSFSLDPIIFWAE